MTTLPLADAVYRFQGNEDRFDRLVNGDNATTVTLSSGAAAPSVLKLQADMASAVNAKAELAAYCQLTSDYTMTSTTAAQKLFNATSTGAVALATGRYQFEMLAWLAAMDGTASSNGAFDLKGAGNATLANILYQTRGADTSASMNTAFAVSGSLSNASGSVTPIFTAAVSNGLALGVSGMFNVTAAGTIIPSFALSVAAAALVKAGSYIVIRRLGATGSNYLGSWS